MLAMLGLYQFLFGSPPVCCRIWHFLDDFWSSEFDLLSGLFSDTNADSARDMLIISKKSCCLLVWFDHSLWIQTKSSHDTANPSSAELSWWSEGIFPPYLTFFSHLLSHPMLFCHFRLCILFIRLILITCKPLSSKRQEIFFCLSSLCTFPV